MSDVDGVQPRMVEIVLESETRPVLLGNGVIDKVRINRVRYLGGEEFLRSCLPYGVAAIVIAVPVFVLSVKYFMLATPVAASSVIYEIIVPEKSATEFQNLIETNAIKDGLCEVFEDIEKYLENALGKDFKKEITPEELDKLKKIRVSSVLLCSKKTLEMALDNFESERDSAGLSGPEKQKKWTTSANLQDMVDKAVNRLQQQKKKAWNVAEDKIGLVSIRFSIDQLADALSLNFKLNDLSLIKGNDVDHAAQFNHRIPGEDYQYGSEKGHQTRKVDDDVVAEAFDQALRPIDTETAEASNLGDEKQQKWTTSANLQDIVDEAVNRLQQRKRKAFFYKIGLVSIRFSIDQLADALRLNFKLNDLSLIKGPQPTKFDDDAQVAKPFEQILWPIEDPETAEAFNLGYAPLCRRGCNVILMDTVPLCQENLSRLTSQIFGTKSYNGQGEYIRSGYISNQEMMQERPIKCIADSDVEVIEDRLSDMPACEEGITTILVAHMDTSHRLTETLKEKHLREYLHGKGLSGEDLEQKIQNMRRNLAVFVFLPGEDISLDSAKIAVEIHLGDGKLLTGMNMITFQGNPNAQLQDFIKNEEVMKFIRETLRRCGDDPEYCNQHREASC